MKTSWRRHCKEKVNKLRNIFFVGLARVIGPELGWHIGRRFLAFAGIGWGGEIQNSGEKRLIRSVIGQIKTPIIFDIGAHTGEYSRECLLANRNSCVHMFEPSKAHFNILRKEVEGSLTTDSQCYFNNAGVSSTPGKKILYKDGDITGSASLIKRDLSHVGEAMGIEEECDFVTLQDYIQEHKISRVDLLKVDVEGEEFNIISNSRKLFLNRQIRVCQFEFGHTNLESRVNFEIFIDFSMK